jgi:hypothetical protein
MIIAADNLNVLHPKISEALRTLNPGPLQETARLCDAGRGGVGPGADQCAEAGGPIAGPNDPFDRGQLARSPRAPPFGGQFSPEVNRNLVAEAASRGQGLDQRFEEGFHVIEIVPWRFRA